MARTTQVVLDEGSFRALSSDSRVNILKSLGGRRRTLSELSRKLSLGTSTVKEHCDVLRGAGLIEQVDEGRKWKYYELTDKGRSIVAPSLYDDLQVLITLCFTVVIAAGVLFLLLGAMGGVSVGTASAPEDTAYSGEPIIEAAASDSVAAATVQKEADYVVPAEGTGIVNDPILIPIIGAALIAGILLGWKFKRK
jgi:DNA-binding transcriptional ArsR family regulator